jgi:transposase-like protein
VQNVSVIVAIGVSTDGYREIIGAAEGMKEENQFKTPELPDRHQKSVRKNIRSMI